MNKKDDENMAFAVQLISQAMKVTPDEIRNMVVLKMGMTNHSFKFEIDRKTYIIRIPGEGTEELINRKQEYEVYQKIDSAGISDTVCYFSPEKGYKITEYLTGSRVCNPNSENDVRLCMKHLKAFHAERYQVSHSFDIWERIHYYETLWNGRKSVHADYEETKIKVLSLKEYVDKQEKEWVLTHIDAVPDNFLIKENEVRLIDWEYAGMQDPHVDIAMFCIYALYDQKQIDHLICIYFGKKPPKSVRIKIYCYISMCGLLWSNWCEYKAQLGVEFGEYAVMQYQYAKDYCKIVREELNDKVNREKTASEKTEQY